MLVSSEFVGQPRKVVLVRCPVGQLDVHIQGDAFRDFKNFAIMYSVYFRLVRANLKKKNLNTFPLNTKESVLFQIEDDKP